MLTRSQLMQVNTMMRRTRVDLEQLEDAINLASEGLKTARRCVQRAARIQKGEDNAHRRPCKSKRRRARNAPERIGPAPGYVPEELPPIGEKWVHMGEGVFVTQRVYKRQLKHQQQKVREQGWNS